MSANSSLSVKSLKDEDLSGHCSKKVVTVSSIDLNEQELNVIDSVDSNHFNVPDDELEVNYKVSQNPGGNIYNSLSEMKIAIKMRGCVVEGRYPGSRILNGVDMSCGAGKIYCLFGANKSGKTTVLKAILQLIQINDGTIEYFDRTKLAKGQRINYMPTAVGLYPYFTISEVITYFGKLMGLKSRELNQKIHESRALISTVSLNIPIWSLDPTQMKMLSFSIALLNDPHILVLDEPTCGTDPLFRHSFWIKLKACANNYYTTVLLTTSDPEECLEAHRCGYLRNGRIITEISAKQLLEQYHVNSMNKAFFCIAVAESTPFGMPLAVPSQISGGFVTDTSISLRDFGRLSQILTTKASTYRRKIQRKLCWTGVGGLEITQFTAMNTLLQKRFTSFLRNAGLSVQKLLAPILFAVLFYYGVGQDLKKVEVGMYFLGAHHCTNMSNKSVECQFFEKLSSSVFNLKMYYNLDLLETDAAAGIFDLEVIINETVFKISTRSESEAEEKQQIQYKIDNTSKVMETLIHEQLNIPHTPSHCKFDSDEENQNCKRKMREFKGVFSDFEAPEADYISWGTVVVINHFCGVLLGGLPLVVLYKKDVIDRFSVIGVTKCNILVVHWLSQTLFAIAQNCLLTLALLTLTTVEFNCRTILMSIVLMTAQSVGGIVFGTFVYTLSRNAITIIMTGILVNLLAFIICGLIWPHETLPNLMEATSFLLPHRHLAESLRSSNLRGLTIFRPRVYTGLIVSTVWTFVLAAAVLYSHKF